MDYQEKLLEKYFSGETSLEEERELKKLLAESGTSEVEQDMFRYFESEGNVPEDLEESVLAGFEKRRQSENRVRRLRWYSIAAAMRNNSAISFVEFNEGCI